MVYSWMRSYLNEPVVGAGNQVGFVAGVVVVDAVDTALVALKSEVWLGRTKLPYLRENR